MTIRQQPAVYPTLPRRIYAAAIDGSLAAVGIVAVLLLIGPIASSPWVILPPIIALLTLEPVLVARTGASIGHLIFGLRVIDADSGKNVSFLRALLRMVARATLGIPSLFLVHTTRRYQAIHDLIARSVVTIRDPASFPQNQIRSEHSDIDDGYDYPTRRRRILVIAIYSIVLYVLAGILMAVLLEESCLDGTRCTPADAAYQSLVTFAWLVAFGATVIYGWRGRMWGCRRQKRTQSGRDPRGDA